MKESFRQSMSWLHTWTGLVVGWILFFVFVTGTASFANQEITRWMQPERPMKASHAPDAVSQFDMAYKYLQSNTASQQADSWSITLASDSRNSTTLSAGWSERPADGERRGRNQTVYLDTASGQALETQLQPRATAGGRALLRMHFALQYMPASSAFIIVGICTMFMLVAIATGVVAHKKIFKDFFTFRHSKGLRSWLDAHNLVSIAALPFFIMITYSGLIFFIYTYMPLGVPLTYGFDDQQELSYYNNLMQQTGSNRILGGGPGGGQGRLTELRRELEPRAARSAATVPQVQGRNRTASRPVNLGQQMPQFTNLTAIVGQVQQQWGHNQIRAVTISAANRDTPAKIQFSPASIDSIMRGRGIGNIEFNALSGERLTPPANDIAAPESFARAMLGLHEGLFAGPLLRWLYLISGFLGCAMIATGLVLWTVKRRPKLQKTAEYALAHAVVEKLNIATIAGLPLALAIYFWANRLLPPGIEERAQWEVHSLFISWLLITVYSVLRQVMPAWRELLTLTAAAWLLLPLLNFITTDRHLLVTVPQGDWVLASIDLVFIVLGLMFGHAGWKVHQKMQAIQSKRSIKPANTFRAKQPQPATPVTPMPEKSA